MTNQLHVMTNYVHNILLQSNKFILNRMHSFTKSNSTTKHSRTQILDPIVTNIQKKTSDFFSRHPTGRYVDCLDSFAKGFFLFNL